MGSTQDQQTAYAIYRRILDSLTSQSDSARPPVKDPKKNTLLMCAPSMAIAKADFEDPWTPGNIHGSQASAVHAADLADVIPDRDATQFNRSDKKITETYSLVVSATPLNEDPPPDIVKQFDQAQALLYRRVKDVDPETGDDLGTTHLAPTKLFADYTKNKASYDTAVAAHTEAFLAAQRNEDQKAEWPLRAAKYNASVTDAHNQLVAAGGEKVSAALATLATSSGHAVQKAFDQAKQLFTRYAVELDSRPVWRSNLLPSAWYDPAGDAGWSRVSFSSEDITRHSDSEALNWAEKTKWSAGLWSAGADAEGKSASSNVGAENGSMKIEYDFTTVTIDRPWMNLTLLSLPNWSLEGVPPGGISMGSTDAKSETDEMWPLLPTAFIAVRNVQITANWSKQDMANIDKAIKGDANVSLGPFSLSGSTDWSSKKSDFHSVLQGNTITVPGVHIIAFMCHHIPYSPPQVVKK